jgi:glutamate decarboxylase
VPLSHPSTARRSSRDLTPAPIFTLEGSSIPRHRCPDGPLSPDVAYQVIHDELMLDGNARLNVATFVTTWMEPQAQGRVPADRGARDALRQHPQPPVERP